MERSRGDSKIIDSFESANDLVDEIKLPDEMVAWASGGYFTTRSEFRRLTGKVCVSTASTAGKILTINQLEFEDRQVVVVHSSFVTTAVSDISELVSLRSSNDAPSLLGTIIDE